MHDYLIAMTTLPTQEKARAMARMLVEQELAACVQYKPVTSVYRLQHKVCEEDEFVLIVQTTRRTYPAVECAIRAMHPYDVAEILAVPVVEADPRYCAWLDSVLLAPPLPASRV
jgi:periplasmic divalent cation tolerance protein